MLELFMVYDVDGKAIRYFSTICTLSKILFERNGYIVKKIVIYEYL